MVGHLQVNEKPIVSQIPLSQYQYRDTQHVKWLPFSDEDLKYVTGSTPEVEYNCVYSWRQQKEPLYSFMKNISIEITNFDWLIEGVY